MKQKTIKFQKKKNQSETYNHLVVCYQEEKHGGAALPEKT